MLKPKRSDSLARTHQIGANESPEMIETKAQRYKWKMPSPFGESFWRPFFGDRWESYRTLHLRLVRWSMIGTLSLILLGITFGYIWAMAKGSVEAQHRGMITTFYLIAALILGGALYYLWNASPE